MFEQHNFEQHNIHKTKEFHTIELTETRKLIHTKITVNHELTRFCTILDENHIDIIKLNPPSMLYNTIKQDAVDFNKDYRKYIFEKTQKNNCLYNLNLYKGNLIVLLIKRGTKIVHSIDIYDINNKSSKEVIMTAEKICINSIHHSKNKLHLYYGDKECISGYGIFNGTVNTINLDDLLNEQLTIESKTGEFYYDPGHENLSFFDDKTMSLLKKYKEPKYIDIHPKEVEYIFNIMLNALKDHLLSDLCKIVFSCIH